MQVGLNALAEKVGIPKSENRSWDAILQKVDPELKKRHHDKSEFFQKNEAFCAEAVALLRSVKIAWRNPTMHVENVYDETKALDVLNAVKGFMRYLATQL
jgi:hypothetical protein